MYSSLQCLSALDDCTLHLTLSTFPYNLFQPLLHYSHIPLLTKPRTQILQLVTPNPTNASKPQMDRFTATNPSARHSPKPHLRRTSIGRHPTVKSTASPKNVTQMPTPKRTNVGELPTGESIAILRSAMQNPMPTNALRLLMDKFTATKPSATPKPSPTSAGRHPTDRSIANSKSVMPNPAPTNVSKFLTDKSIVIASSAMQIPRRISAGKLLMVRSAVNPRNRIVSQQNLDRLCCS